MYNFIFDLQRFDDVTIATDQTYTLDGVTYTATSNAVLNLDDGKVSGLASGSVTATIDGAESLLTVTFDATDEPITFTATGDGSVITVTQRFPIELISGEFTYKGNTMTTSAGAKLAIVSTRGDYKLRNESTPEYGATYTLTDAALTVESQHTTSTYSLTNGSDVRQIQIESYGKLINNFDEIGFTLVQGSSQVLTIGGYTITATAVDQDAGLNIQLSENGVTLVPNSGDGTLNVALSRGEQEIFAGELECTSGSITFGFDKAVTLAENTSFNFTWEDYVTTISTTAAATTDIALSENGISFTPGNDDGALNLLVTKSGTPVFGGALNVTGGTISFDATTQKFSFTEGTKIALVIGADGSREIDLEVTGGDANLKIEADENGNFTITPDENDGSLVVTLKQNGENVFQNTLSVNGSMIINPVTNLLTLKDGTTVSVSFNTYTLTATASGDAASTMSLSASGISITPQEGDGTLDITLTGTSSGSLSANIEILSGGFLFGLDGALTVTEGTELKIDFGNGYIVDFKANDAAGGAISIGADGITFAPNADDGGLQLSITRDGETRSASLDVTGGSVTYKLDGSISLAQGTVVRNVFDSGNILTITANTDASGSITFNPQKGLTITPTSADALNVVLSTDNLDVVNVSSIVGSINYNGGVITASDGTKAHLSYYFGWESDLYTTGGTASVQFTDDRTIYTANEGSTFTVDYLNGTTTEIQKGSYADVYGETIENYTELVSEGTILRSNDAEVVFTLEKAGNYTLNGMAITTTQDNVEVSLPDYNTVTFDADAPITVSVTDGDKLFFIDEVEGKTQISTQNADNPDVTDGTVTFDNATKKVSFTAGTNVTYTQGNQSMTFTVPEETSAFSIDSDGLIFAPGSQGGNLQITMTNDGETRTADFEVTGSITYELDGSISLTEGTVVRNVFESGNVLTIIANTDASGSFILNPQDGLTINSLTAGALNLVLSTGDLDVINVSELEGEVNYKDGLITASDGTKAHLSYYFGFESELSTTGGPAYIQFTDDSTIYRAGEGSTFTVDYLDGTTTEIQNGSYIDVYGETLEDYTEFVAEGTILRSNDEEVVYTLEKAGNYTLNGMAITTTQDNVEVRLPDYNAVQFDADAPITVSALEGDDKVIFETDKKSGTIIAKTSTGGGSGGIDFDFDDEETITITGGGNEDIDLSKENYDVAYIDADARGKKNIKLSGDDMVVVEDAAAKVSITASKGNDTIISNSEKVFVSLRGGNTDIFAQEGKMTVAGYNASTGSGFHTDYEDILTAIDEGAIKFDNGNLTIGSAVITDNSGNNAVVNLFSADGDLQKVGEALPDTALNLSKEKADMILVANENSTLTAGSGNDTIYASEGSHVDGGAGRNYIEMDARAESAQGVKVALTNGKNTIANFKDGFDYESDRLFVGVNDTVDFKFDGTDLKVKVNNTTRGIVTNIADGSPFVNFLLEDTTSSSKIVAIQKGETVAVEDEVADYYVGNKSGVDFSNYAETININLGTEEQSIGAGEVLFDGVNQITVGGGLNTLIGSSANETLTGNSDGITEFGFGAGGGRDVINNFNFDEDKLNISDAVTGVKVVDEGNVRLQVGEGSDFLTIQDAQGKHFSINGFTAKVDNNIDFDDTANYFVATSRNATLTVGDDVEGDAIIWLDNPARNGSVFKGDIKTLDASNATVKTELAGNDLDNTIFAGNGDASLWGGNGGDDLLIGGNGVNTFFYANGNGSDTITETNDGDKIILSGVALENIIGADFTDSAVAVKFSDGGQLTVNEAGKAVDFIVGEQTFRVNDEHNGFTIKN